MWFPIFWKSDLNIEIQSEDSNSLSGVLDRALDWAFSGWILGVLCESEGTHTLQSWDLITTIHHHHPHYHQPVSLYHYQQPRVHGHFIHKSEPARGEFNLIFLDCKIVVVTMWQLAGHDWLTAWAPSQIYSVTTALLSLLSHLSPLTSPVSWLNC